MNTRRFRARGATVLVLVLFAAEGRLAAAQPSDPEAALAQNVLGKIHATDIAEIEAGELATDRGESVLVRAMGDRLARDHRMADALVIQAAQQMGVAVSPPNLKNASDTPRLAVLHGRNFDQAYVTMMIEGHLRVIASLSESYDQQPKGAALKTLLGKLLPILKQHLQVAENVKPWI